MFSPHAGIQGLVELARRDRVELRPVLLRVLTDLYVQEPAHGPAEKARYAELACRFLDSVDPATRATVAERLANYADTPPAVAAKLARDDISVAGPILRRSTVLTEAELHSVLDHCGIAHAIAVGKRENLPASVAERLREIGTGRPASTAARPRRPEAVRDPALTFALARRFLVTGPDERRLILTALPCCPRLDQEERLGRLGSRFKDGLERAALRHRAPEFAALLREHAGMPSDIAERVICDPSGEPLAAICRALDLSFDTASRIVLFLNPAIGASVGKIFGLAGGYRVMEPASAMRLMAAWCGLGAALRAPRTLWTRRSGERNDPRAAPSRTIRCVTPARPAAANEL